MSPPIRRGFCLVSFPFFFFLFIITVFFQDDDLDPLIPIVLCSKVQTACDEFMSGINGWLVASMGCFMNDFIFIGFAP